MSPVTTPTPQNPVPQNPVLQNLAPAPQNPVPQGPIAFGFAETWRNKHFWLPLAAILSVISVGAGYTPNTTYLSNEDPTTLSPQIITLMAIAYIVALVISVAVSILFTTHALRQGRNPHHVPQAKEWTKDIPWKRTILASLVSAAAAIVVCGVFAALVALAITLGPSLYTIVAVSILIIFASIFIAPFFTFVLHFAIDGAGPVESFKKSLNLASRNYGRTLGIIVLYMLITFGGGLVAGVATVPFYLISPLAGAIASAVLSIIVVTFILPAMYLAYAKLYIDATGTGQTA